MLRKKPNSKPIQGSYRRFRRAALRGLAVLLPPLLTIVIFVWIGRTVADYLLEPLEYSARQILVSSMADIRKPTDLEGAEIHEGRVVLDATTYARTGDGNFIPAEILNDVRDKIGNDPMPATAIGVYERYVNQHYLQRHIVIPVFLLLFVMVLYLLGKFLAAGMGKFFLHQFEGVVQRIPLIRNVYSSVKQVTDFMFSEREIEYNRVVAVEYPRKGIWSLGMVTGESMLDIQSAANEPVLSVLIPTSPMPFTGFTMTVKKSETIDLDITIDQAFQFIVSCGVVVPPHQMAEAIAKQELAIEGPEEDLVRLGGE